MLTTRRFASNLRLDLIFDQIIFLLTGGNNHKTVFQILNFHVFSIYVGLEHPKLNMEFFMVNNTILTL